MFDCEGEGEVMNDLKCPKCGSTSIATERHPDGSHVCGDCKYYWPNKKEEMKPTYKKLHELIELAEKGVKFKARHIEGYWQTEYYFKCSSSVGWTTEEVIHDWKYQEHKEPEVVEFECEWFRDHGIVSPNIHISIANRLRDRTWKVVCTEVVDE